MPRNVIEHPCREGPSVRGSIVRLRACLRGVKGEKKKKNISGCALTKNLAYQDKVESWQR